MPTPMARRHGLATTTVEDELVVYDAERKAAHCLDATAAAVFALMDGTRSLDEIAEAAGLAPDRAAAAVEELRSAGLLDEPRALAATDVAARGVSRRQALKRGAVLTGAVVITSIALPAVASAQSIQVCGQVGQPCIIDSAAGAPGAQGSCCDHLFCTASSDPGTGFCAIN